MVQEAHKTPTNQKLNLVVLGACTNVASAILEDPTIVPKISVHYIGFWHTVATNHYDKKEFNTDNDPLAVELLLNTEGLDFNVMTATTCQHLVFEKLDVDAHLKGKGSLADYLVDRWESYTRWWTDEDPEKKRWIMWDVAIIEALAHPEFSQKTPMKTPPENTQRFIGIHTSIKVDAMIADFWNSINY
jgi:inosine-uridine nucleoside N-ribohydrolase